MSKAYPKEAKAHTMSLEPLNNVALTPIKSPAFSVKNYIPTVWLITKPINLTAQHFSWFAKKGQALELAALDNTERPSHENYAT